MLMWFLLVDSVLLIILFSGHIRLSYFGKWRQVERKPCDKKAVKRLYVAPEMSQVHEKKTEACDWWSIGTLLYELLTGRVRNLPSYFYHMGHAFFCNFIISGRVVVWSTFCYKPVSKIIQMYLHLKCCRPTGIQCCPEVHVWYADIDTYTWNSFQPLFKAHPAGINSHTILALPDHISPEAKSLLTGLLQYYPTQRLGYGVKGLDDIMSHVFFDDTEWDILIEECSSSWRSRKELYSHVSWLKAQYYFITK